MTSNLLQLDAAIAGALGQPEIREELRRWFGADFSIWQSDPPKLIDGSGTVATTLCEAPGVLEGIRRSEEATALVEENAYLVLAIPMDGIDQAGRVAVGAIPLRDLLASDDRTAIAETLGIDPGEVELWFESRTKWAPMVAHRFAMAFVSAKKAESRARTLEIDLEDTVGRLTSSYEELSLLHRLTQHSLVSGSDAELGNKAVRWLLDYLPAKGAALLMLPAIDADRATYEARSEAQMIAVGEVPFDTAEALAYTGKIDFSFSSSPHLMNLSRSATTTPLRGTRQLVVAEIGDRKNVYGYAMLVNHVGNRPFGACETTMMGSVGAILGIHCGNYELYRQHREFLASVVRALTSAIDAKDPYTFGHSDRVARIAVRLARELGCETTNLHTLYMAGLLHDIGKIGVNDAVLQKPGALTDDEFRHIQAHPQLGFEILADIRQLSDVLPIVLHHHEQWDGRGYPHGLEQDQIPLLARVAAVADAFDAMTSDRPYRRGMPIEKVEQILRNGAGTQWDPAVVDAYFRCRDEIIEIVNSEAGNLPLDVKRWIPAD